MNLHENIYRIKEVMGIISEDISQKLKRRIKLIDIDKLVNNLKVSKFVKNVDVYESVDNTITNVVDRIIPFEELIDEISEEEFDELNQQLTGLLLKKYEEQLKEYFLKRQKEYDEELKGDQYSYIFRKFDNEGSGFSEGFKTFNDLITKYGTWIDVDWDEIKKKLDSIESYPTKGRNNTSSSLPIRLKSVGEEGNDWGYNFSVTKVKYS